MKVLRRVMIVSSPRLKAVAIGIVGISMFAAVASTPALAAPTVIDFDGLTVGDVVTDQFPEATFSTSAGFDVLVTTGVSGGGFGNSLPNFICTGSGRVDCEQDVFVDFTNPVNGLTFLAVGDNDFGKVGSVDVFENDAFSTSVDIVSNGSLGDPIVLDLSAFIDVTRIAINSITDGNGLGYDDFTFTPVPVPAALPLFATAIAGLGFAGWRRKKAA